MNLRKTQKSLKEPFKARSALFRTRTAETICKKRPEIFRLQGI